MWLRTVGLIITLAIGNFAAPLEAEAQPAARAYRVGVLLPAPAAAVGTHLQALREGLRELGYVEGQNLALELKWVTTAESELDRLAADLVQAKVDVLVTWTTPATLAAMRATSTVPIVMVAVGDPVGNGLVASLARPGGNVTGVSNVSRELSGKLLELLREIHPGATRIAALRNPTNPASELLWRETQTAAQALGVQLQLVQMHEPGELEAAFAAMLRARASGAVVLADALFLAERNRIAALARKARLPTVFERAENVEAGGLMSYGPKLTGQFRQAAAYVDKILRGAKPADLPVEQPTTFELVINRKTAAALGLTIPPSLLVRADRVIE
jgi:putative ABC transport system substrate-binding protein